MINHFFHDIISGMDNIRKGGAGNFPKYEDYVAALNEYLTKKGLNEGQRDRLILFYTNDIADFKE